MTDPFLSKAISELLAMDAHVLKRDHEPFFLRPILERYKRMEECLQKIANVREWRKVPSEYATMDMLADLAQATLDSLSAHE